VYVYVYVYVHVHVHVYETFAVIVTRTPL
jgi:hypothetical protein